MKNNNQLPDSPCTCAAAMLPVGSNITAAALQPAYKTSAFDAWNPEFVVFSFFFLHLKEGRGRSCGGAKGCRRFEMYFESDLICSACLLLQLYKKKKGVRGGGGGGGRGGGKAKDCCF